MVLQDRLKIYTTPKTYIHDITVTSDIDFGKAVPSATLHYEVDIEGADKDNTACKVEVFDAEGKKGCRSRWHFRGNKT